MAKNVFLKDKAVDLRRAFEGEETMTTETPPDWVLLEAAKRADCDVYRRDGAFLALCNMIQKHEKPPVDRKRLCALEARDSTGAEATTVAIAIRAIELWEEGFGK